MAFLANTGSVSAPSFTFAADPDTGIYQYTTGSVGIAAGGSNCAIFGASSIDFRGISDGFAIFPGSVVNLGANPANFTVYGANNGRSIARLNAGANYQGVLLEADNSIGSGTFVIRPDTTPGSGTAFQYLYVQGNGIGGAATTILYPLIDSTVRIGGTLPSAPNITLSSAGDITAAGDLECNTIQLDRDGANGVPSLQIGTESGSSVPNYRVYQYFTAVDTGETVVLTFRGGTLPGARGSAMHTLRISENNGGTNNAAGHSYLFCSYRVFSNSSGVSSLEGLTSIANYSLTTGDLAFADSGAGDNRYTITYTPNSPGVNTTVTFQIELLSGGATTTQSHYLESAVTV